jgi:hypothetical protein
MTADDDEPPLSLTQCIENIKNKDAASWGWSAARTCGLIFFLYVSATHECSPGLDIP